MEQRYVDLGETLLDTRTGLEWQKDAGGRMSWDEAMEYASSLRLGKHSDWRLPTIEELLTLIDFSKTGPASSFPGVGSGWFWSSSSYSGSSSNAWIVIFNNGNVANFDKTNSSYVRCIRRGPLVLGPQVPGREELMTEDLKREITKQVDALLQGLVPTLVHGVLEQVEGQAKHMNSVLQGLHEEMERVHREVGDMSAEARAQRFSERVRASSRTGKAVEPAPKRKGKR